MAEKRHEKTPDDIDTLVNCKHTFVLLHQRITFVNKLATDFLAAVHSTEDTTVVQHLVVELYEALRDIPAKVNGDIKDPDFKLNPHLW